MSLEQWMEQLSEDDGFDALEPDEGGAYCFFCDAVEVCARQLEDGSVLLEAALDAFPKELSDKAARIALQANHLFEQTAGAVFAWDSEAKKLILRASAMIDDADGLEDFLEGFVAQAERWQALLGRYAELQAEAKGSDASDQKGEEQLDTILGSWLVV